MLLHADVDEKSISKKVTVCLSEQLLHTKIELNKTIIAIYLNMMFRVRPTLVIKAEAPKVTLGILF